jgi:hypothetical protein
MTDEQWLACESPARMRREIRSRPFPGFRWLLFDLACVERVRDLLTPSAVRWLDDYADWDGASPRDWNAARRRLDLVGDEMRVLWTRRADALRGAKVAAARAVLAVGSYNLTVSEMACVAAGRRAGRPGLLEAVRVERQAQAALMRCVFRSSLAPVAFSDAWRTDTVRALATQMRLLRDYSAVPILADAIQEAGCDDERILTHCRCGGPHVRGCWVVDLVLGAR